MRGATYGHPTKETRARRQPGGQHNPHLAAARRPIPRPDEGLPQGGQGAGARARAEAAPGLETIQAGDRKAHLEARAAGEIDSNRPVKEARNIERPAHSWPLIPVRRPGLRGPAGRPRDREMRALVAQELTGFEVAQFEG